MLYICVNQCAVPVHQACLYPYECCVICSESVLGIVKIEYRHVNESLNFEKTDGQMSRELLERARQSYKSWHLKRAYTKRYKALTSRIRAHKKDATIVHLTGYGCLDWKVEDDISTPGTLEMVSIVESHQDDIRRIKKWFRQVFLARNCSMCVYYFNNGEMKKEDIQEALPESYCKHCGVAVCRDHIKAVCLEDDWDRMLKFGSQNKPHILIKCTNIACNAEFCKYRLFRDKDQLYELHVDGPFGQTPFAQCCIMQNLEHYDSSAMNCEVEGCTGLAFCSPECKETHTRVCGVCFTDFHVHEQSKKYCETCILDCSSLVDSKSDDA